MCLEDSHLWVSDIAKQISLRLKNLYLLLVHFGQINSFKTLQKAITLHDFVVEVGQGAGRVFIYDECEPKPQTGNIHGTTVNVHAIDTILDDMAFGFGWVEGPIQGHFGLKNLLQHSHRKRPRANGRVADFYVVK